MRKRNWKLWIAAGLAVCLFTGCGASAGTSAERAADYSDYGDYGDYEVTGTYAADEAYAENEVSSDSGTETQTDGASDETGTLSQDKIIYTANVSIETLTYAESYDALKQQISDASGVIESESESNSNYYWYESDSSDMHYLSLTVRIPSAGYSDFLDSLDEIGKVQSKSQNAENISTQYRNTEAEIRGLETQEERLLEMMETAETVEDMITVESRLSEVQIALDQARTSLAAMDTDVAYSTVYIYLEEVVQYTDTGTTRKTSSFFDRLKNTVSDSWSFFLELLEGLLFLIIYLIPVAILVVIILLIIRSIWKKRKAKHPIKTQEKKTYFPGKKKVNQKEAGTKEAGTNETGTHETDSNAIGAHAVDLAETDTTEEQGTSEAHEPENPDRYL